MSTGDPHLLNPGDAQAAVEGWMCVVELCCRLWWWPPPPYKKWRSALKKGVKCEINCGAIMEILIADGIGDFVHIPAKNRKDPPEVEPSFDLNACK